MQFLFQYTGCSLVLPERTAAPGSPAIKYHSASANHVYYMPLHSHKYVHINWWSILRIWHKYSTPFTYFAVKYHDLYGRRGFCEKTVNQPYVRFLQVCGMGILQGSLTQFQTGIPQDRSVINPRPAGVWLVTRPAGGGGAQRAPLRSPKLLDRFPNFKRHSIALYVNYPYKVKNLTRRSLMTSQVRSKSEFSTFRAWWHRRVKFRC